MRQYAVTNCERSEGFGGLYLERENACQSERNDHQLELIRILGRKASREKQCEDATVACVFFFPFARGIAHTVTSKRATPSSMRS